MTPGGTISTSPTFNSTLREPTATPTPQPGPFGPPSGLFVLCRPLTSVPSMNAVPPPERIKYLAGWLSVLLAPGSASPGGLAICCPQGTGAAADAGPPAASGAAP